MGNDCNFCINYCITSGRHLTTTDTTKRNKIVSTRCSAVFVWHSALLLQLLKRVCSHMWLNFLKFKMKKRNHMNEELHVKTEKKTWDEAYHTGLQTGDHMRAYSTRFRQGRPLVVSWVNYMQRTNTLCLSVMMAYLYDVAEKPEFSHITARGQIDSRFLVCLRGSLCVKRLTLHDVPSPVYGSCVPSNSWDEK